MGGVKLRKQQKRLAVRIKQYEATHNKHAGLHKPGSHKK